MSTHLLLLWASQIYSPLQFAAVSSSSTVTHMPVDMIDTCSFYNCQTCKQIFIIVLNKMPSFLTFYVIKMHKI